MAILTVCKKILKIGILEGKNRFVLRHFEKTYFGSPKKGHLVTIFRRFVMKATRIRLSQALRLIASLGNLHFRSFPTQLTIPGRGKLVQRTDAKGRVCFYLIKS